jgi:hypothetical protein
MVNFSIRRPAGLFLFRNNVPISLRDRFAQREIIRSLPVRTRMTHHGYQPFDATIRIRTLKLGVQKFNRKASL